MSVPRYWRGIKYHYRLIGSECLSCGKRYYPPRKVCPICHSRNLRDVKLPERGKVLTFTVIRVPPRGYEKYAPYVIAIVELIDGTRVLAQLTDIEPEEVNIGIEVEAVLRKICENGEEGIIQYGIKFRPVFT